MSYNIRHASPVGLRSVAGRFVRWVGSGRSLEGRKPWNNRREFVVQTIRRFRPDLLGAQEARPFQRDYLAEELSQYEVLGAGRDDGKEKGDMVPLYYRRDRFEKLDGGHFWLSKTPDVPGSKSWDSAIPRMTTWAKLRDLRNPSAPPIAFFNTHLDRRGERARWESARLLRRRLAEIGRSCSLILTGDFNAGEGSQPYQELFEVRGGEPSPILDTYRAAHPEREPEEGTYSGFRASATNGPRLDWIGTSRHWRVVGASIDRTARGGRTASDHFPVTAVLRYEPSRCATYSTSGA